MPNFAWEYEGKLSPSLLLNQLTKKLLYKYSPVYLETIFHSEWPVFYHDLSTFKIDPFITLAGGICISNMVCST